MDNMNNAFGVSNETLEKYTALIGQARMGQGQGREDVHPLVKAYTTGLGLVGYNLEAPAKQIVPFLSPLRNKIPRKTSNTGVATHWKTITAVAPSGNFGAVEGARGGAVTTSLSDNSATYKIHSLQDSVSLEAIAGGRNFQDAKATAVTNLLLRTMTQEEIQILFGVTTTALGTVSLPSAVQGGSAGSGGSLASATYTVYCAAMTGVGANGVVLDVSASSLNLGSTGMIVGIAATNATGSAIASAWTGVTAVSSAATAAVSAGAYLVMDATVVSGACAYAWFVGLSAGPASLQLVTSYNHGVLYSLASGGTLASTVSVDGTADAKTYDGILPQLLAGGCYYKNMNGAKFDKSGAGVQQLDDLCAYLYSRYKLGPTKIWCGYQAFGDITNAIVATGGSPTLFVMNELNTKANIVGGYRVATYVNKYYNGQQIELEVHPWMPASMVIALSETIPYPNANIPAAFEIENGYDYMQLEYAVTTPKYEFEIRFYGAVKSYFPAACGVIMNLAPGLN